MTKRILVVEDQEDLRGVLRDLLTGSGYEMLEAADGQAGVDKAKSERPDLILMDIQMPVMDGYDATRQNRGRDGSPPRPPNRTGGFPAYGSPVGSYPLRDCLAEAQAVFSVNSPRSAK
jgi:CheY-like chemotaxis protein